MATLQMALSKISRRIKEAGLNLEEHGVLFNLDQGVTLHEARVNVLDAADKLHSLAYQMVGDIKKETKG